MTVSSENFWRWQLSLLCLKFNCVQGEEEGGGHPVPCGAPMLQTTTPRMQSCWSCWWSMQSGSSPLQLHPEPCWLMMLNAQEKLKSMTLIALHVFSNCSRDLLILSAANLFVSCANSSTYLQLHIGSCTVPFQKKLDENLVSNLFGKELNRKNQEKKISGERVNFNHLFCYWNQGGVSDRTLCY